MYAHENWKGIKKSLLEGEYNPLPVRRVEIPKDSGGTRELGYSHCYGSCDSTSDLLRFSRLSLILISQKPVSDSDQNHSAHQAVKKVLKDIQRGYCYAVDIDLEKFFDTVDHDVLMNRVSRRIRDKGVLRLIGKYLRAGVVVNGRLNRTARGVPQGGPLVAFVEQYPSG